MLIVASCHHSLKVVLEEGDDTFTKTQPPACVVHSPDQLRYVDFHIKNRMPPVPVRRIILSEGVGHKYTEKFLSSQSSSL